MAATAGHRNLDGLKASLRVGVQHVISGLSEEILADEDGMDYLCTHIDRLLNLLTRASTLFFIPEDLISLLLRARQAVSKSTSNSEDGDIVLVFYTGCRGRPAIAISKEQLELYLEYGFTAVKKCCCIYNNLECTTFKIIINATDLKAGRCVYIDNPCRPRLLKSLHLSGRSHVAHQHEEKL